MAEKKKLYQAETMALPPLKMVLGDLPEPDPGEGHRPFRVKGIKDDEEARGMVRKLIGRIQEKE
ncbi:MAG: hypothetical protein N2117_06965 [Anaerolineales bacterium]|nr:hypothetical protein [Anaerolineales bacterium]MCX7754973.1 hypothetical protein [Anaerolineales bacterium]MDW8277351.1 hypothetical protein [Anaerolineales bacterium]